MPRFQLEIGGFLCGCALISLLVFFSDYQKSKAGRIKLPTHVEELDGEVHESDDPFNVTKPEDTIDGTPIREEEFWQKVGQSCTRL